MSQFKLESIKKSIAPPSKSMKTNKIMLTCQQVLNYHDTLVLSHVFPRD